MKTDEILKLYDAEYAQSYDDKFLSSGYWKHGSDFEMGVLAQLLARGGKWLDVGCGTGYFLNQFPGVPRAGLDISPAMLDLARQRNPDALFVKQGDMRDAMPEWREQWDVVSCLWYAYCYVESMREVQTVIRNLSEWTSEEGALFLPVSEMIEDLSQGMSIPYCTPQVPDSPVAELGGPYYVTGLTWTWQENQAGQEHKNLVAPHIDYLVEMLREHFNMVAKICYPPYKPGWRGRRAILATEKRGTISTVMKPLVAALADAYSVEQEPILQAKGAGSDALADGRPIKPDRPGWLRRAWRRLPPEARRLVKAAFGES